MSFPPEIGAFTIEFRGLDIVRGRDCVVFSKGDAHPVIASPEMVLGGWAGGQGVQWTESHTEEPMVTYSQGLYGGFMLWGSDESADKFTAMTGVSLVHPQSAVMMAGNAMISTSSYERYTYASRVGGSPLVPLVYKARDPLYFSRRGLFTVEDEASQGTPLSFAPAFFTGFVYQAPAPVNQFYLGVQTSL
jgi:hypothetical protein